MPHRTFGCVRLVWNKALAERTRRYKAEGRSSSCVDTASWLTTWKREPGLGAERTMYPRFKSKKNSRTQALAIEDLTVRNLTKNHTLARAISDAAWAELRSMLEYKTSCCGRHLLRVDRFFPSSKLCSTPGCAHQNISTPLKVRSWTCPACGAVHDRDVNAARNILAAGPAER